ncbi:MULTISPECIES: hypothetical protein [unclassified Massilia]|nr:MULTISPECIES: hypothetical protein [unclassified Massilia]
MPEHVIHHLVADREAGGLVGWPVHTGVDAALPASFPACVKLL